jgi:cobalamin biosynthesis protein CobT
MSKISQGVKIILTGFNAKAWQGTDKVRAWDTLVTRLTYNATWMSAFFKNYFFTINLFSGI